MPVPQDARLALNAIEPLDKLKAELSDPNNLSAGVNASFDTNKLIGQIDGIIASLNEMVTLASGGNAEAAQQEMEEEAALRSQGQQSRHQKAEECVNGGEEEPENLPGRRPRRPSVGRRLPVRGARVPQALPRLTQRRYPGV